MRNAIADCCRGSASSHRESCSGPELIVMNARVSPWMYSRASVIRRAVELRMLVRRPAIEERGELLAARGAQAFQGGLAMLGQREWRCLGLNARPGR
jgi:hypothetical protein